MTCNQAGLDLIKHFEGCRLEAYQDQVHVFTIGYGHTEDVKPGQIMTQDEAEATLLSDIRKLEVDITPLIKTTITDNEFAALVSFSYNLGINSLQSSLLLRVLNTGNKEGAANQFLLWNHAGGKVVKGLTLRRQAERALFLTKL